MRQQKRSTSLWRAFKIGNEFSGGVYAKTNHSFSYVCSWLGRPAGRRAKNQNREKPCLRQNENAGRLVGGKVNEGGTALKTNARFQLVSDGSVLAAWLGEGSPHEMVTMFHMDGNQLMATHYCAAHNQPRMALVNGGDQNRLVFTFKEWTTIQPDAGHMQQVAFVIDGPNHHIEEWTYLQNGKEDTTRFDFRRK